jgi:hypothetical protein
MCDEYDGGMLNALERAMTVTTPGNEQVTRPKPSASGVGGDWDRSELKPATGVHPAAIATALAAYGGFIIAAWIAFGQGYAALDLTVVVLINVVLLGLLVGGAMMSRSMTPDRQTKRSFGEFVNGPVDTATGEISGREAFVQIAVMPILLAIGGSTIAAIFFIGS